MSIPGPAGEWVTWRHAAVTGTDARGNDIVTFTGTPLGPCAWVPGAEAEAAVGTEQVTAGAVLYAPPGTCPSPLDQVQRASGDVYEITGDPDASRSPFTGTRAPVKISLKRVTGVTAHLSAESSEG